MAFLNLLFRVYKFGGQIIFPTSLSNVTQKTLNPQVKKGITLKTTWPYQPQALYLLNSLGLSSSAEKSKPLTKKWKNWLALMHNLLLHLKKIYKLINDVGKNFHVFEIRIGINVFDHRNVLTLLSSSEKAPIAQLVGHCRSQDWNPRSYLSV